MSTSKSDHIEVVLAIDPHIAAIVGDNAALAFETVTADGVEHYLLICTIRAFILSSPSSDQYYRCFHLRERYPYGMVGQTALAASSDDVVRVLVLCCHDSV